MMKQPKQPKHTMRVLTVASSKGGVAKTTLSAILSVKAATEGLSVALVDTDPQLSLSRWYELRGEPDNPKIEEVDAAREALGMLIAQKRDLVIIDTPPAFLDKIENAVSIADFVLIPTKPGAVDLEAVRDVVGMCKDHHKPFAFVISQVIAPPGRLVATAREYLEHDGHVLAQHVMTRKPYMVAMTVGKTGPEMKDGKEAAKEIDALWAEIKAWMRKP